MPKDEVALLREALKECCDDLEAYINYSYGKTLDYPSQRRKYDNEMAIVLAARALIDGK